MDREEKPKLKPIIKRRRSSSGDLELEKQENRLGVIQESEEIIFNSEPIEFVNSIIDQLEDSNPCVREQAVGTIIGLKIEHGRLV